MTSQEKELLQKASLPKWPMLKIAGDSVTPEQAQDIILRTDGFFTELDGYSNHREFAADYRRLAFGGLFDHLLSNDQERDWKEIYQTQATLRAHLKCVITHYIHNTWADSSYVGGPYGWCHPDGTIAYSHNVGKWPSAEEIYEDLEAIAQAWPFLKMQATLYSGDMSDENVQPVISFQVEAGKVTVVPGGLVTESEVETPDIMAVFQTKMFGTRSGHCAFTPAEMTSYADRVLKQVVDIVSGEASMLEPFEYNTDASPEENFLAWYQDSTSERDALNQPSLSQAEAEEIFCALYSVELDLKNYFEKVTKNS